MRYLVNKFFWKHDTFYSILVVPMTCPLKNICDELFPKEGAKEKAIQKANLKSSCFERVDSVCWTEIKVCGCEKNTKKVSKGWRKLFTDPFFHQCKILGLVLNEVGQSVQKTVLLKVNRQQLLVWDCFSFNQRLVEL